MEYVAVIGLLFAPVICLLCAGWFFVRWKNEHENQKLALRDRKTCFVWLIAAATRWVRLKYAAMNLKKLANWSWKNSIFRFIFVQCCPNCMKSPASVC